MRSIFCCMKTTICVNVEKWNILSYCNFLCTHINIRDKKEKKCNWVKNIRLCALGIWIFINRLEKVHT